MIKYIARKLGYIKYEDLMKESTRLHTAYVLRITTWVEDDFGVPQAPNWQEEAEKWWKTELTKLLNHKGK